MVTDVFHADYVGIYSMDNAYSDAGVEEVARLFVTRLSHRELTEYAVKAVADIISDRRRRDARDIEQRSMSVSRSDVVKIVADDFSIKQQRTKEENIVIAKRIIEDPSRYESMGTVAARRRSIIHQIDKILKESDISFEDWYANSLVFMRKNHKTWKARAFQRAFDDDEVKDESLFDDLSEIVKDFRQSIILELTADLLETEFSVGDGEKTTWGDATEEQHKKRATILAKSAITELETVARHEKAVEMIHSTGVSRLNDLR